MQLRRELGIAAAFGILFALGLLSLRKQYFRSSSLMVNPTDIAGLIVAPDVRYTTMLDEFIASCDWPVVARPAARTLIELVEAHRPQCVAFWLDCTTELSASQRLVSLLRDRGPRPLRIAIADTLPVETEHAFRSAGVHSYFSATSNMMALLDDAIIPFLGPVRVWSPARVAALSRPSAARHGPLEEHGASLHPP